MKNPSSFPNMNFYKAGWAHEIYLDNSPTKGTTHSLRQQVCCRDILRFSYLLCFLLSFSETSSLEDGALGYCSQHWECRFIDTITSFILRSLYHRLQYHSTYAKETTFVLWLPDLVEIHMCTLLLTWVPGEKIWYNSLTFQIWLL